MRAKITVGTGASNHTEVAVLALLIGPLVLALGFSSPLPISVRLTGGLLWVACIAPAWFYARRTSTRPPLPFLPMIGLVYGAYFALPPLFGLTNLQPQIQLDAGADFGRPLSLLTIAWFLILAGYSIARRAFARFGFGMPHIWDAVVSRRAALMFLYLGVAAWFLDLRGVVPLELAQFVHFTGVLMWLGGALLVAGWVQSELTVWHKTFGLVGVTLAAALLLASGLASNAAFFGAALLLGGWVVRQAISWRWLIAVAGGLALLMTFRGVIPEFRAAAWFGTADLSAVQRVELVGSILSSRLRTTGPRQALEDGAVAMARRSAHLELFAEVVRRTPHHVPFWEGETYLTLIGFAIPRLFWPEKPTKEIGQAFGHRYALIAPTDIHTSVNLPYVIEFYVNFALLGIILGALLVGVIYGGLEALVNRRGQPLLLSLGAIVWLLPLANVESDFSLTFGGLFLNGIALLAVLYILYYMMLRRANVGVISSKSVTRKVPSNRDTRRE